MLDQYSSDCWVVVADGADAILEIVAAERQLSFFAIKIEKCQTADAQRKRRRRIKEERLFQCASLLQLWCSSLRNRLATFCSLRQSLLLSCIPGLFRLVLLRSALHKDWTKHTATMCGWYRMDFLLPFRLLVDDISVVFPSDDRSVMDNRCTRIPISNLLPPYHSRLCTEEEEEEPYISHWRRQRRVSNLGILTASTAAAAAVCTVQTFSVLCISRSNGDDAA